MMTGAGQQEMYHLQLIAKVDGTRLEDDASPSHIPGSSWYIGIYGKFRVRVSRYHPTVTTNALDIDLYKQLYLEYTTLAIMGTSLTQAFVPTV